MVRFTIRFPPTGLSLYIPKELREILGRTNTAIPNTYAMLVFAEGTPLDKVLSSLELIKKTILLELECDKTAPLEQEGGE